LGLGRNHPVNLLKAIDKHTKIWYNRLEEKNEGYDVRDNGLCS